MYILNDNAEDLVSIIKVPFFCRWYVIILTRWFSGCKDAFNLSLVLAKRSVLKWKYTA